MLVVPISISVLEASPIDHISSWICPHIVFEVLCLRPLNKRRANVIVASCRVRKGGRHKWVRHDKAMILPCKIVREWEVDIRGHHIVLASICIHSAVPVITHFEVHFDNERFIRDKSVRSISGSIKDVSLHVNLNISHCSFSICPSQTSDVAVSQPDYCNSREGS